jgi:hypothetical protein
VNVYDGTAFLSDGRTTILSLPPGRYRASLAIQSDRANSFNLRLAFRTVGASPDQRIPLGTATDATLSVPRAGNYTISINTFDVGGADCTPFHVYLYLTSFNPFGGGAASFSVGDLTVERIG